MLGNWVKEDREDNNGGKIRRVIVMGKNNIKHNLPPFFYSFPTKFSDEEYRTVRRTRH